eukprot:12653-Heterococcus_DN1.PRE.2
MACSLLVAPIAVATFGHNLKLYEKVAAQYKVGRCYRESHSTWRTSTSKPRCVVRITVMICYTIALTFAAHNNEICNMTCTAH